MGFIFDFIHKAFFDTPFALSVWPWYIISSTQLDFQPMCTYTELSETNSILVVLYSVEVLFFAKFTFNEFIEVDVLMFSCQNFKILFSLFLSDFMMTSGVNCSLSWGSMFCRGIPIRFLNPL